MKDRSDKEDIKLFKPYELTGGIEDEEQRIFCWLHAIIGMPASKAYRAAFRGSSAQLSSCAAQASRLLRDYDIAHYIRILHLYHRGNQLVTFNEAARTEYL